MEALKKQFNNLTEEEKKEFIGYILEKETILIREGYFSGPSTMNKGYFSGPTTSESICPICQRPL